MATSSKPTIILVPGAWHVPANYLSLTSALEAHGYSVQAISLPSSADAPTTTSFQPDVAAVRSALGSTAGRGEDILLLMHSFGGVIGSEACKGLLRADRAAQGLQGGIMSLFYMCSITVPEITFVGDANNGKLDDWIAVSKTDPNACAPIPSLMDAALYNDVPPHLLPEQKALLKNFSMGAFFGRDSTVTYAPWKSEDVCSTYLLCELDYALKTSIQEMFVKQDGARFEVVKCRSGHSPWLSMPDFTVQAIRRAAGEVL